MRGGWPGGLLGGVAGVAVGILLGAGAWSTPAPGSQTLNDINAITGSAWSPAECSWAVSTLDLDRRLDLQAADQDPADRAYYTETAGWWERAAQLARDECAGHPPAAADVAWAEGRFAYARDAHVAWETRDPGQRAWHERWAANYARLLELFRQLL